MLKRRNSIKNFEIQQIAAKKKKRRKKDGSFCRTYNLNEWHSLHVANQRKQINDRPSKLTRDTYGKEEGKKTDERCSMLP